MKKAPARESKVVTAKRDYKIAFGETVKDLSTMELIHRSQQNVEERLRAEHDINDLKADLKERQIELDDACARWEVLVVLLEGRQRVILTS